MVFGGQGGQAADPVPRPSDGQDPMAAGGASQPESKDPRQDSQSSPSPVTDGENAYVFFEDFGLLSYGPESEYARIRATGNYLRCECAFAFHNELCVIMPCQAPSEKKILAI